MFLSICRSFMKGVYHFCFAYRRCTHHIALTGLQPTGTPHLGNYLGIIKPCMELQRSGAVSTVLILIADLHALTSSDRFVLSTATVDLAATLIACLWNDESCSYNAYGSSIFLQSAVRGHTELAWILCSCCSMQRLSHLPQWRDKAGLVRSKLSVLEEEVFDDSDNLNVGDTTVTQGSVGLFTYPVLQAADILLYGAHVVPVGQDQTAHIELARYVARVAVSRWPALEQVFPIPTGLIMGVPKVKSLRSPTKKMSKSDPTKEGIIYLTDPPDTIRTKIKRAQTDSIRAITYDPVNRPGVANLLRILAALGQRDLENVLVEAGRWDKEFLKFQVTDTLVEHLNPIRLRVDSLKNTDEGRKTIRQCLQVGSEAANKIAEKRLGLIYSAIGCGLGSLDTPVSTVESLRTEQ